MWNTKGVDGMSKKNVVIISSIIFVVFNVVAFVIPTDFTSAFWVAYVFTCLAFAIEIVGILHILKNNEKIISKFYRIPLLYVLFWYFVGQLLVFLIFKFVATCPAWIPVLVSVVVLAIAIIGLITLESAANYVQDIDRKVKDKVFFIKSLQVDIELLENMVKDSEKKQLISKLAEKIKYSDPMSSNALESVEKKICDEIEVLKKGEDYISEGQINKVLALLEERNKKCKLLK